MSPWLPSTFRNFSMNQMFRKRLGFHAYSVEMLDFSFSSVIKSQNVCSRELIPLTLVLRILSSSPLASETSNMAGTLASHSQAGSIEEYHKGTGLLSSTYAERCAHSPCHVSMGVGLIVKQQLSFSHQSKSQKEAGIGFRYHSSLLNPLSVQNSVMGMLMPSAKRS